MNFITRLIVLVLFTVSAHVKANECAEDPIIGVYLDARDNDIPALDALGSDEKEEIKAAYQGIVEIAELQFVDGAAPDVSELRMRNDLNLTGLSSEDWSDKVIGVNLDLIFSQMSAEDRVGYINTLRGAVSALSDNSEITFGQYNDRLNRDIVESALISYGCPGSLLDDYGLSEYSPAN